MYTPDAQKLYQRQQNVAILNDLFLITVSILK
jgi:hypothetical protein